MSYLTGTNTQIQNVMRKYTMGFGINVKLILLYMWNVDRLPLLLWT